MYNIDDADFTMI